jgi:hypothetical protein
MHKRFGPASVAICGAVLVGGIAIRANAQVNSHAVLKTADYSQTTDNVAAPLSDVRTTAGLFTAHAGDITSADVTFPGAASATTLAQSGTSWTVNGNFASKAAADAAYPNGNYLFHTAGGTVGTTNDTLTLQSTYPAEGVFTGTSIHDLQTMNPTGAIHITFNGFTPDAALNDTRIGLTLFSASQGFQSFNPPISATDFTFPAGTFVPSTNYFLTLQYFNDNLTHSGRATDESDYSSYTAVNFTTAPEPGSLGAMLLLGGALAARRRSRR